MKKNSKKENKICFILYTFTSILYLVSGIMMLKDNSGNGNNGFTHIALSVTFGSIAYIYYDKYKKE